MIIVSGTRRSGTSAWMQILQKGGFRILGNPFPADWEQRMSEANPRGFYESTLVQGINYHTNPDPRSGAWMPPDKVRDIGVKIFADGLLKTDFAYIDRVIVSIRKWQECDSSQARMNDIRSRHDAAGDIDPKLEIAARLPAGFSWWKANFSLVRDMQTRRYPAAVFSYEALLREPEKYITAAFAWLGAGDARAAAEAVDGSLQTQKDVVVDDPGHAYAEQFDELYEVLHTGQQISPTFYSQLLETDARITRDISAILA